MVENLVVACVSCGQQRAADCAPVDAMAWSAERDGGVVRWLCPTCARAHVRDIEGKLPVEYW